MRVRFPTLLGVSATLLAATAASSIQAQDADQPLVIRQAARQVEDVPAGDEFQDAGIPLIDRTIEDDRVYEQYLQDLVRSGIAQANAQMGVNPLGAIDLLKTLQQRIRGERDVRPEVIFNLNQAVESALAAASRALDVRTGLEIEEARRLREAEVRERLVSDLITEEVRLEAIMQRFEALMDERQYVEAEQLIRVAQDEFPDRVITVLGVHSTAMSTSLARWEAIRDARERNFVAALETVEESSIPFPDTPPIIYPDPEVWERLTESRKKYASVDLSDVGESERRIRAALDQPTRMDFNDAPLEDVVDFLTDYHKIQIILDNESLDAEGLGADTPVTVNLSNISLRSGLRIMLRQLGLTYVIENEVLLITTQAEAETKLTPRVYPVADLVIPVESSSGQNLGLSGLTGQGTGFNGGGGGGGFGGGGGGFGGGGFGGGGGGFGGGGGGFFNVPPQQVPAQPQDGEARASQELIDLVHAIVKPEQWDVNGGTGSVQYFRNGKALVISATGETHEAFEDLRKGGLQGFAVFDDVLEQAEEANEPAEEAPAAEAAPEAPAQGGLEVQIEKGLLDGASADAVWEQHFAQREEADPAVRAAVRALIEAKKFDHVSALIEAALRHGQAQPWMYEALGLALRAQGASPDHIERTLLSAADIQALSPSGLMYLAKYLAQSGFEHRALKLYRQAALMEPTAPEAYLNALELAQRHWDLDAIQWSVVGVLGQAWAEENESRWQQARNVATMTLDTLRASRQFQAADEFQAAVAEALQRDLILSVSWTGEADIDLIVQEPSGKVCSRENPRTTGGGVLLGDAFAAPNQKSQLLSETYVCPEAFNGTYQVRVRRTWGKPTAGRVTVDVYSRWGTPEAQHIRKQITVGDDDQLVLFNVDEGRRDESISEQLVANAVDQQVAMRRDLLLQQLNDMSSSAAAQALNDSRNRAFAGASLAPFLQNAAVGFQPVIITLSEGVQMQSQGVVSADRRYVRFSGTPFFSGIGDVTTFNVATGETSTRPFNSGASAVPPGSAAGGAAGNNNNNNNGGGGQVPGGGGACALDSVAIDLDSTTSYVIPVNTVQIVNCSNAGTVNSTRAIVPSANTTAPFAGLPGSGRGYFRITVQYDVQAPLGTTLYTLPANTILFVP